jgi:hypothetical protein
MIFGSEVVMPDKYNFIGDSNGEFLHCLITLFKGMMYNENEVHI